MLPLRHVILVVGLSLAASAWAAPAPVDDGAIFEMRLRTAWAEGGQKKALAFIEKTLAKKPLDRARAYQAIYRLQDETREDRAAINQDWMTVRALAQAGDPAARCQLADELFRGVLLPTGFRLAPDNEGALAILRPLAEQGHPDAHEMLSWAYLHGRGVPRDIDRAWWHAERALWIGRDAAALRVANEVDPKRRLEFLLACARQNSGGAMNQLATAAKNGDAGAQRALHLARLSLQALGGEFPSPLVKAARAAIEAQAGDDALAHFILAYEGFNRESGAAAGRRSLAHARRAAELGLDDGLALVARHEAEGRGTAKDVPAALAKLRALEAKGNTAAIAALGYYAYWGSWDKYGWPKDPARAFDYCRRAAEAGDISACANAAFLHEHGLGTETDYREAARLREMAARRGHKDSYLTFPRVLAAAD